MQRSIESDCEGSVKVGGFKIFLIPYSLSRAKCYRKFVRPKNFTTKKWSKYDF